MRTLYRRRDGSACLRGRYGGVELPAVPDTERRFHFATTTGALITDRRGPDTRIRLVTTSGVFEGPSPRNPRALVRSACGHFAMVVSEVGGSPALVTVGLPNLGWDHSTPWPEPAEVTDLVPCRDPVIALDPDEEITSIHGDALLAMFTSGPRGARLTLGEQEVHVLDLPSPGYAPLLASGPRAGRRGVVKVHRFDPADIVKARSA